eukprot:233834_1
MAFFYGIYKEENNEDIPKPKTNTKQKTNGSAKSKGCVVFDVFNEQEFKKDELLHKYRGRWPKGVVPYIISDDCSKELIIIIKDAMNEFHTKTPIKWKLKQETDINFVLFMQSVEDAFSQCGCLFEGQQVIMISYPYVPGTKEKMTRVGVMHEMMHCLGFLHEHQRIDAPEHHNRWKTGKVDRDFKIDEAFISIGHYDYRSIMHYNCAMMHGFYKDLDTQVEMEKYVGKSKTFSTGDIAAIKILYGINSEHYGEWHMACTNKKCNDQICYCDSCGNSIPWCGFHGKRNINGHWTCCMNEDKNSVCHSRGHTGFWHMNCDSRYGCTDIVCKCGACGAGCKHKGKAAHWSCCYVEEFDKWCTKSPIPNLLTLLCLKTLTDSTK